MCIIAFECVSPTGTGLLVPLHDIMNHDLAHQNIVFSDGVDALVRRHSPNRRYIATTTRAVAVAEPLRDRVVVSGE